MKKIKLNFTKKPLNNTPKLGLLMLAEQRHRMSALMLDWYQELVDKVADELEVSLYVASLPDPDMSRVLEGRPATLITTTPGAPLGERHNEALSALQDAKLDGVITLSPGDLLDEALLRAYGAHLKEGGLFAGLLDLHLFDPNEFKFMHWARYKFTEGVDRVAPVGYLIARPFLDALKWRLWPNQAPSAGGFHKRVMERVEKLFNKAPKGTCLSQTMQHMGGVAISLKSELARALFEEGNWQRYPGLEFADFESSVEEQMSEAWVERLGDFDERLRLDIVVDGNPDNLSLWKTHYDFCIYKFLPYADVRLHMISDGTMEAPEGWRQLNAQGASHERWNQALAELKEGDSDLVLFAGRGGLVDLKTIEHYLIYIFRHGARLLTVQNFYVADQQERTLAFWPGEATSGIPQMFGFGTCVHRDYLDALGWSLFDKAGLHQEAQTRLEGLISDTSTKQQRVIFKCASHELGLISFDAEETLGFEGKIRLGELQTVNVSRLPFPCFNQELKDLLSVWALKIDAPASTPKTQPARSAPVSAPTSSPTSKSMESNMSEMSPLERAKALLAQSKGGAAPTPAPAPAPAPAPSAEMSPLERAKALLAQSKGASAPTPAPAPAPAPASAPASAPAPSAEMSPLERAKALLAQSKAGAPAPAPAPTAEEEQAQKQAQTQGMIQEAIQSAESVVAQLTAQRDAAVKAAQEATQAAAPVNPAAALLCEQGEAAFEAGDLSKASTLFESALLIDASCVRALSDLAVVATHQEQPWQALSYLLLALVRDHEDQGVVENLQGLLEVYPELKVARSLFV